MFTVHSGRVRPDNRVPTVTDKQPSAQFKTYTAPIGGLVSGAPLADQQAQTAVVLENFWPTTTGIEPRGGSKLRVTIDGGVEALFQYRAGGGDRYFAADENSIYAFDGDTVDGTALTAVVTEQTVADYATLEMQTDGGSFLIAVNGADPMQIYDGADWQQVTSTSSPLAVTGVSTDRLAHVWSYRNRVFFVEKNTMNAWYLGINAIAGPAIKLPLSGLFKKGGSLLFGATWSSDSGAGMDDRCVFATDQGEFAIYTGGDPGDGADWALEGVYDFGEPLGKNCSIQVGGDLIVATAGGLVPLSAAMQKDPGQLKLQALSRPIEPDWHWLTVQSGGASGWQLAKWVSRSMALVAPPDAATDQGHCWGVNLETGAWTKFSGWQIGALNVLGAGLYYGDGEGNIFLCDVGGYDGTKPFECRACFGFDALGAPGAFKSAQLISSLWRFGLGINPKLSVASDYLPKFPAAPNAATFEAGSGEWDTATWDVDNWASDNRVAQIGRTRSAVSGQGEVLAPQVQLTSAQSAKLDCELISLTLAYSVGEVTT